MLDAIFIVVTLGLPPLPGYFFASRLEKFGLRVKFVAYLFAVCVLGYYLSVYLVEFLYWTGALPEAPSTPGVRQLRMPDYKVGSNGAAFNALCSPVTFLIARYLLERRKDMKTDGIKEAPAPTSDTSQSLASQPARENPQPLQ